MDSIQKILQNSSIVKDRSPLNTSVYNLYKNSGYYQNLMTRAIQNPDNLEEQIKELYNRIDNNFSQLDIIKSSSPDIRKGLVNLLIQRMVNANFDEIVTLVESPFHQYLKENGGLKWYQLQILCVNYLILENKIKLQS